MPEQQELIGDAPTLAAIACMVDFPADLVAEYNVVPVEARVELLSSQGLVVGERFLPVRPPNIVDALQVAAGVLEQIAAGAVRPEGAQDASET
jgi:hypothetical protein